MTDKIDCQKHGLAQETHCIHPRLGMWMCKKCFEEGARRMDEMNRAMTTKPLDLNAIRARATEELPDAWARTLVTDQIEKLQSDVLLLLAENALLRKVAEAARADLNTVATMPWCRLNHRDENAPTCVANPVWRGWIYGSHQDVYEALAALDNPSEAEDV